MKKTYLFLVLTFTLTAFSQDSKMSLEVNYPVSFGDNFMANYTGIIDLGAKYRFIKKENVNFGVGINTSLLSFENTNNPFTQNYTMYAIPIQPKVFAEFNIKPLPKLHPYASLGYSFILFQASGSNNGTSISGYNETQSGINLNLGLAIDVTKSLFLSGQYDYIKVNTPNGVPESSFNTNVSLFKFGLGVRL